MPDGSQEEKPSREELEAQLAALSKENLILKIQLTEVRVQLMEATMREIQVAHPQALQELVQLRNLLRP